MRLHNQSLHETSRGSMKCSLQLQSLVTLHSLQLQKASPAGLVIPSEVGDVGVGAVSVLTAATRSYD